MEIENVCVIGAGVMGSGIAQLAATHRYQVNLVDINEEILKKAKASIDKNLNRFFVAKNKISNEEADNILNRIHLITNRDEAINDVQIVIEAVFEDMALKQQLLSDLDEKCDKEVIIASNTSSLCITDMAMKAKNQERIVGIHFFNPAPVMKLIELIKGKNTSNEIMDRARQFSKTLNKTVVTVNDSPGFITTRLIYVLCNEAINMKQEGIANTEDIDTAVKLAFNFPMGPLELSDLVGNDIYLHIGEYLSEKLGKNYQPSPLLHEMVKDNQIGRKTKKGFYNY
ncbi:MAG: 3-hydroxyacyl-CoA dehydrogenase family protein [Candidatus Lokiarchaeota archaeon]|nr:3-hydroxyacyl-CoA dehydrogenase family protein [Candidatus Lokiarchaeota archaeon]